jgi:hypothetical protein
MQASSLAIRLRLSDVALVTPVRIAVTISSSQREMVAQVLGARHDHLVHPRRLHPAPRAAARARVIRDRPNLHRAIRPRLRVSNPQPRNAE